jgi:hypothetical protein
MGLILSLKNAFVGGNSRLPELATLLRDRIEAADAAEGLALDRRERATYDRLMDALNRLPRPLMALGTLSVLAAAMVAPVWFADRMQALSAMPDALWWVIGGVISLYFGARIQSREQEFQREMVDTIVRLPGKTVPATATTPRVAETGADAALVLGAEAASDNPALDDWRRTRV